MDNDQIQVAERGTGKTSGCSSSADPSHAASAGHFGDNAAEDRLALRREMRAQQRLVAGAVLARAIPVAT